MYRLLPILLFAYGLAVTTEDIYDNSYALIIGIDKYENVRSLNYAVNDAETIQDILVSTFNFPQDNVKLLTNEDATRQNILREFSDITTKAEDKDRVLIYFAGHGDTDDLPDGGETGYLLPVDGDNENLFLSSISMDDLKKIAFMSKAKHMLYLVDACYGGLLTISSRGLQPSTTPNHIEKLAKNKSRQIITAGGKGEEVMESAVWGHSAFTLNLIRGLKDGNADMDNDRYITANELGLFLKNKVTIDTENQQTPQYGQYTSHGGEFVFVLPEEENTAEAEDDNSRNAQLDLILSKLEELKSQKNLDTTLKNQNNNIENIGMSGLYWQKELGAGFMATPTNTVLELYNIINDHLELSVQYAHSIDKIPSSLSGTQSNQMHLGQLSVIYSHVLSANPAKEIVSIEKINRYRFILGVGLGYAQVLWTDSALDFNYFITSAIGGLGVKLLKISKPISTQIGCKLLFELSDQPHLDENGEAVFDKNINIKPKIIFLISFPK